MLTHTGTTRYYTLKYTNKKNEVIEANIEMVSSYPTTNSPARDEWQKATMITIKLPEQGKEEDIQIEQGDKNWSEYENEALSQFLEELQ